MTNEMEAADIDLAELMLLAERAVRELTTTELHGAACGVLAGGGGAQDLVQLLGEDALVDSTTLVEFWRANAIFAFAEDLRFCPNLPAEDEADLATRVDGLAQWSASFLAGFMRLNGGNAGLSALPEETREIVQDLAAIAGAEADTLTSAGSSNEADPAADQNEADYVELVEFVRVAVLLLVSARLPAVEPTGTEPH